MSDMDSFRQLNKNLLEKTFKKESGVIRFIENDVRISSLPYHFVDAGSNRGFYVKLVLHLTSGDCCIWEFEPENHHVDQLLDDLKDYHQSTDCVEIHNQGLWSVDAIIPFYSRRHRDGKSSTEISSYIKKRFKGSGEYRQVRPLSHYSFGHIDILKIDTEGAEWNILYGAIPLLEKKSIRNIVIEYHKSSGHTVAEFVDFLNGYGLTVVGPKNCPVRHHRKNTFLFASLV